MPDTCNGDVAHVTAAVNPVQPNGVNTTAATASQEDIDSFFVDDGGASLLPSFESTTASPVNKETKAGNESTMTTTVLSNAPWTSNNGASTNIAKEMSLNFWDSSTPTTTTTALRAPQQVVVKGVVANPLNGLMGSSPQVHIQPTAAPNPLSDFFYPNACGGLYPMQSATVPVGITANGEYAMLNPAVMGAAPQSFALPSTNTLSIPGVVGNCSSASFPAMTTISHPIMAQQHLSHQSLASLTALPSPTALPAPQPTPKKVGQKRTKAGLKRGIFGETLVKTTTDKKQKLNVPNKALIDVIISNDTTLTPMPSLVFPPDDALACKSDLSTLQHHQPQLQLHQQSQHQHQIEQQQCQKRIQQQNIQQSQQQRMSIAAKPCATSTFAKASTASKSSSSSSSLGPFPPTVTSLYSAKTMMEDNSNFTPEEQRRHERNLREQQRSYKISQQIKELRTLLSESNIPYKPNKFSILMSVVDYIKHLQNRAVFLDAEHQRLNDTIQQSRVMVQSRQIPETLYQVRNSEKSRSEGIGNDSSMLFVQGIDYKSVFGQCSAALCVASLDGRFLDCNLEFENLLGYSKNELTHQSLFNMLASDNIDGLFEVLSDMLKENSINNGSDSVAKSGNGSFSLSKYWSGVVSPKHRDVDFMINITLTRSAEGLPKFFNCALSVA